MDPRQRLFRAVKWALGLSLFTLAFVVFGFGVCLPATTTVVSSAAVMNVRKETSPLPDAPQKEWDEWDERRKPVRDAVYNTAGNSIRVSALFVGLPVAVLLVVIIILLYRVRGWLERGV